MSKEWISTNHLTLRFVEGMLAALNQFAKGEMEDVGFVLLEKDNPIDQMLTGKFVVQLQPKELDYE